MTKEALEDMEEGIRVGGELIKDVKYADDLGMVSSTESGLQILTDRLNATAKSSDMKINVKKTKTMVVSRHSALKVNISIDGQRLEQVTSFRYLEALISEDGRCIQNV